MAGRKDGQASKTNAAGRAHDPRPKSELVVECYRKPSGALAVTRRFVPINRDSA